MKQRNSILQQAIISAGVLVILLMAGMMLMAQPHAKQTETPASKDTNTVEVSQEGGKAIQIETAPVVAKATLETIQTTGQLSYPADQTVKISPRVQGRVRQVFVRVGDRVRVGQPLVLLDSVDAATAQTNALQAENKRRLAQNTLERQERLYRLGTPDVTAAQATLDQAHAATQAARDVLDRTRQQANIGGFTQKPVEDAENALVTAKSTRAQAQSDLAQAQRDFDRKSKLLEIGVAAKSDLESAQNVLEKAQVNAQAGEETVRLAQQALERERKAFKSNLYADQQVRQAESAYRQAQLQEDAAARALRLAKAQILRDLEQARSDYQAAQTDAANARTTLAILGSPDRQGLVTVKSPVAGVVTERNVNPGSLVDQSQETPWQMLTISNSDSVWVDADVYEKDIARIAPGQAVQIRVAALPDKIFRGRVLHIAPLLDAKSRAVKVRAEIANPRGDLKDGMYADVTLLTGRSKTIPQVPLAAVQHDGEKDYVYVAQGGKYVRRDVHVAGQKEGGCQVDSGLQSGERIVTHGAMFLGNQASGD